MATLVSGNPGSGKSTMTALLRGRGVRALDADEVPGLAAWMDASGDVVGDGSLEPTPELLATCIWGWNGPRVEQVVEELGADGVLLGIAVNQWDFVDRFDGLVLLELDAATQRDRVASPRPRRGAPPLPVTPCARISTWGHTSVRSSAQSSSELRPSSHSRGVPPGSRSRRRRSP